MASRGDRIVVAWGHLALLAAITIVVVAYLLDARSVSLRLNNLLLVQPAAFLALFLVACVVPQCFRRLPADEVPPRENLGDLGRVGALAAAFAAMALSLETIGFDVATFLFMVAALYICGERRWWLNLAFSAVFTALLVWGYGTIIPFPFPLTVL